MNFTNTEYLNNVRQIVQFLGNSKVDESELQDRFPLIDIPLYMSTGIRQGWTCKTQILPNQWRANVDMMRLNSANWKLEGYVGSFVIIPPRLSVSQYGPSHEPFDNTPRSFIDFKQCGECSHK